MPEIAFLMRVSTCEVIKKLPVETVALTET